MRIEDISRSMMIGHASLGEINRGNGLETFFLIKNSFSKSTVNTEQNNIQLVASSFNIEKTTPIAILLKVDNEKAIYNLWLDLCDSTHRNLIGNLKSQSNIPILLTDEFDQVVKTFEITNNLKIGFQEIFNTEINVGWDKMAFFEALNKLNKQFGSSSDLWASITKERSGKTYH